MKTESKWCVMAPILPEKKITFFDNVIVILGVVGIFVGGTAIFLKLVCVVFNAIGGGHAGF